MDESEQPFIQVGIHLIDPERDKAIGFRTQEGNIVDLSQMRSSGEPDFMTSHIITAYPGTGEIDSKYARLKRKLEAGKEYTVEYIEHNKGKIAVIGSAVLLIAAGAGITVHRFKKDK